jgi:uncharacterized protein YjiS (DUF1127 family)
MSQSVILAEPASGQPARSLARRIRWRVLRSMVWTRTHWRTYRRHRETRIFLAHVDERLLYDIGLEPLDLIEQVRTSRARRMTYVPRHLD